jgi:hypothetical protein
MARRRRIKKPHGDHTKLSAAFLGHDEVSVCGCYERGFQEYEGGGSLSAPQSSISNGASLLLQGLPGDGMVPAMISSAPDDGAACLAAELETK